MGNPLGLYEHLTVENGEKALAWYAASLGASVKAKPMADDGKCVLSAIVNLLGGHISVSDHFPDMSSDTTAPGPGRQTSCTLHVDFEDPNEVNRLVAAVEAAGAKVTRKPEDVYWGDRYGRIRDPFGHVWPFGARAVAQYN